MKSHYHSDLYIPRPHLKRVPWRRAQGRGGRGHGWYRRLYRLRPQGQMIASAQAQHGGRARAGGSRGRGCAEGAGLTAPGGGGVRSGGRGLGFLRRAVGEGQGTGEEPRTVSYMMGAGPAALGVGRTKYSGAEESARGPPSLPCPARHSLALPSSLADPQSLDAP